MSKKGGKSEAVLFEFLQKYDNISGKIRLLFVFLILFNVLSLLVFFLSSTNYWIPHDEWMNEWMNKWKLFIVSFCVFIPSIIFFLNIIKIKYSFTLRNINWIIINDFTLLFYSFDRSFFLIYTWLNDIMFYDLFFGEIMPSNYSILILSILQYVIFIALYDVWNRASWQCVSNDTKTIKIIWIILTAIIKQWSQLYYYYYYYYHHNNNNNNIELNSINVAAAGSTTDEVKEKEREESIDATVTFNSYSWSSNDIS